MFSFMRWINEPTKMLVFTTDKLSVNELGDLPTRSLTVSSPPTKDETGSDRSIWIIRSIKRAEERHNANPTYELEVGIPMHKATVPKN